MLLAASNTFLNYIVMLRLNINLCKKKILKKNFSDIGSSVKVISHL